MKCNSKLFVFQRLVFCGSSIKLVAYKGLKASKKNVGAFPLEVTAVTGMPPPLPLVCTIYHSCCDCSKGYV